MKIMLEEILLETMRARGLKLAAAESCTGGLISDRITNISGSSEYFPGGIVAYSNEAKASLLGVSWDTLNKFGAVSPETATEMARGVRERFSSTLGLSVTGIAGPGGGMPGKPIGLTYIGLATQDRVIVEKYIWQGDRIANKEQSAEAALDLLYRYLTAL